MRPGNESVDINPRYSLDRQHEHQRQTGANGKSADQWQHGSVVAACNEYPAGDGYQGGERTDDGSADAGDMSQRLHCQCVEVAEKYPYTGKCHDEIGG